jgi:hypothetical protein
LESLRFFERLSLPGDDGVEVLPAEASALLELTVAEAAPFGNSKIDDDELASADAASGDVNVALPEDLSLAVTVRDDDVTDELDLDLVVLHDDEAVGVAEDDVALDASVEELECDTGADDVAVTATDGVGAGAPVVEDDDRDVDPHDASAVFKAAVLLDSLRFLDLPCSSLMRVRDFLPSTAVASA